MIIRDGWLRWVLACFLVGGLFTGSYGQTLLGIHGGNDFGRNDPVAGLQGHYHLPPLGVNRLHLRHLTVNPSLSYLFEPDVRVVELKIYATKVAFWNSERRAQPYAGIGPAVRHSRFAIPDELSEDPEMFDNEDLDMGLALKAGAFLPPLLDRLRPFAEVEVALADGINVQAGAGLIVTVER